MFYQFMLQSYFKRKLPLTFSGSSFSNVEMNIFEFLTVSQNRTFEDVTLDSKSNAGLLAKRLRAKNNYWMDCHKTFHPGYKLHLLKIFLSFYFTMTKYLKYCMSVRRNLTCTLPPVSKLVQTLVKMPPMWCVMHT